jgi:hypothetical protein
VPIPKIVFATHQVRGTAKGSTLLPRRFGQLEDFNNKNKDEEYYKAYMRRIGGHA